MSAKRGQTSDDGGGPIDFTTLTDYQDEFLRADKRYLGFVSGVGAGKTYAGIVRTFLNMEVWNAGEMGAIVAPTRQMVINVIIPEMRELGLLDNWTYNSSYSDEPGLHAPNGSRALILSADNKKTIERLRGLNLAWGWIDERTAVPDRAKEILMQRLRTGNYRNLFETTTPKGRDGTYEFYVERDNVEETKFGEATIYDSDDRMAIVGVPTRANPELPEDYQEAMVQDMAEQIRQQEVMGQFVQIGGGLYTPDMLQWVDPVEDINDTWDMQTIIGVDPAATTDATKAHNSDSDYWGVVVAQLHLTGNTIYVVDSHHRRGMSLREGVQWLKSIQRSAGRDAQFIVEINQSQRWLRDEMQEANLPVTGVNTTRNKEDKLLDMSIPISNGRVKWVDWSAVDESNDRPYQELRNQLRAFPDGSHDDLADALSLILNHGPISTGSNISVDSKDRGELWD